MPTNRVTDLGRQLADGQASLVQRWSDATDRYLDDLRRFADGEIDAVTLGRDVAEIAAAETVHSVETAARLGISYVRFVSELGDPRRGRRDGPTVDVAAADDR